jgi:hypothetical protein
MNQLRELRDFVDDFIARDPEDGHIQACFFCGKDDRIPVHGSDCLWKRAEQLRDSWSKPSGEPQ